MEDPDNTFTGIQGKADDKPPHTGPSKNKLYSPIQGGLGTVLGGPLAGAYFIKSNFDAMDDSISSRKTVIWGTVINLLFLLSLPFIPVQIPRYIIPAIYSFIIWIVIAKMQLTVEKIVSSPNFESQSNWKVLGISLLVLPIYILLIYGICILYYSLDIINAS